MTCLLGLCLLPGLWRAAAAEPAALTVGRITISSQAIFSRQEIDESGGLNRLLRGTMNRFHVDTRAGIIRHELLFREGDAYDPLLLDETERNLRALGFLTEVSVTAVDTTADGRVDILVSSRETWTLETSVSYSQAGGGDQRWSLELSEDNFLGRGVTVGAGLGEDENSTFWNLWYRQRRLSAGLTLDLQYSKRGDGEIRRLAVGRPFYAQDDAWSVDVAGWDSGWEQRIYLSNGGPAGADAQRTASLYTRAPYADRAVQAAVQRRLSPTGRGRVWRLGAGLRAQERLFDLGTGLFGLSDGRVADLGWLLDAGSPLARRQGTLVYPYLWLRTLGRSWAKVTYARQYGPVEDIPLGWDLDLKLGPAGGAVGSTSAWERERWRAEAAFQKWLPLLGGHAMLAAAGEGESGDRQVRNYVYDEVACWMRRSASATPWLLRGFAEYAQGDGLSGAQALVLGLDRGVRTLDYDGMAGDRLVRWNVEVGRATAWRPAGLFRLGLAAFYAGGGAWWRDETRTAADLRHEVGLGLRFGPTRSAGSRIARVDVALDLDGGSPVLTAVTGGDF